MLAIKYRVLLGITSVYKILYHTKQVGIVDFRILRVYYSLMLLDTLI